MTLDEMNVDVSVSGYELDDEQQAVVDLYEENVETFIRKNHDYSGSFTKSAKVESILKHGEIVEEELPETVARQIFVRGFLDKISRFYQLTFCDDERAVDDESTIDTLLDLGNYAIMLASQLRQDGDDK